MMLCCLRNRTLLKLIAGEEAVAQPPHLDHCPVCQARYQRLRLQFRAIEQTLLTTDPPMAIARSRERAPLRAPIWWVPVAATLAGILLLSWQGVWRSPIKVTPPVSNAVSREEMYTFLEDAVTPAFIDVADTEQSVFSPSFSFDHDSLAVLNESWPCEEGDLFASPECESLSFSLAFEEF
jgi:hypothetical protein